MPAVRSCRCWARRGQTPRAAKRQTGRPPYRRPPCPRFQDRQLRGRRPVCRHHYRHRCRRSHHQRSRPARLRGRGLSVDRLTQEAARVSRQARSAVPVHRRPSGEAGRAVRRQDAGDQARQASDVRHRCEAQDRRDHHRRRRDRSGQDDRGVEEGALEHTLGEVNDVPRLEPQVRLLALADIPDRDLQPLLLAINDARDKGGDSGEIGTCPQLSLFLEDLRRQRGVNRPPEPARELFRIFTGFDALANIVRNRQVARLENRQD